MRRRSLVWMALGLALVAVLPTATKAAVVAKPNGTSTNATESWDEDDDFVPYQGDRFDLFDWNLCKELSKRSPGNVLVSPISVKLALVLLYEGSQGQTARELAAAMELPAGRAPTRDRFSTVLKSLQAASPNYILDIGTRLYVDASIIPRQRYAAIVKTFYSTDVINANLSDTVTSARGINDWVSNVTHGKVGNLISDEESLKESVLLVLNALYFMGTWKQPFPKNATKIDKFYTSVDKSVDVPFMNMVGRFYYSNCPELDATILRLPYLGHKYAMFLILPNARAGLDQLTKDINPFILKRHMWLMDDIPVDLSIPKFKFDFTSHLETVLREMGIRDIFDNTASMPGIARGKEFSRRLIVTDVVQKAGIDVDEQGTTAHAVTEVIIGNKISDTTFHVRHPFMFFIEDETTGTVVFVGKVTNPLEVNGVFESTEAPTAGTPNQAPIGNSKASVR